MACFVPALSVVTDTLNLWCLWEVLLSRARSIH